MPQVSAPSSSRELLVGILVGGRGLRMGGVAKGNLRRNGQTLLERSLQRISDAAIQGNCEVKTALVGASSAYEVPADLRLDDHPAGIGPMGGVRALLRHAQSAEYLHVIALAVDLPYLQAPLLKRLYEFPVGPSVVAPREQQVWQPLCARYRVAAALPAVEQALLAGQLSLQRLIVGLGPAAHELPLAPEEVSQLWDWDSPADLELEP